MTGFFPSVYTHCPHHLNTPGTWVRDGHRPVLHSFESFQPKFIHSFSTYNSLPPIAYGSLVVMRSTKVTIHYIHWLIDQYRILNPLVHHSMKNVFVSTFLHSLIHINEFYSYSSQTLYRLCISALLVKVLYCKIFILFNPLDVADLKTHNRT